MIFDPLQLLYAILFLIVLMSVLVGGYCLMMKMDEWLEKIKEAKRKWKKP